jgi:integrative and conjugative element protein (TIGR02256 family)
VPQLPSLKRRAGTLTIAPSLLAHLMHVGWTKWPLETGGVLLGHRNRVDDTIAVVIGPGPDATHERFTFTPDADWQAREVANAWARDTTIEYLGDWHTHPGGTTRFSTLDREAAQSIAEHPPARQPEPVMLVLALGHDLTGRVAATRLVRGRLLPLSLQAARPAEANPRSG